MVLVVLVLIGWTALSVRPVVAEWRTAGWLRAHGVEQTCRVSELGLLRPDGSATAVWADCDGTRRFIDLTRSSEQIETVGASVAAVVATASDPNVANPPDGVGADAVERGFAPDFLRALAAPVGLLVLLGALGGWLLGRPGRGARPRLGRHPRE